MGVGTIYKNLGALSETVAYVRACAPVAAAFQGHLESLKLTGIHREFTTSY